MDRSTDTLLFSADDLGRPIPESGHAVSVCLPLWEHNVGYEELTPCVVERMQSGYPRFFLHPLAADLFRQCEARFAESGQCCYAFPSRRVAERCARFVSRESGSDCAVHDLGAQGVYAVSLPREAADTARAYWQHSGEIVCSRLAAAVLQGRTDCRADRDTDQELKQRIAESAGGRADDVLLFPTGMAAIYAAYRAFQRLRPNLRSVQFGFPYVDTLKIQQRFSGIGAESGSAASGSRPETATDGSHGTEAASESPNVALFPCGDAAELAELERLLERESIMGLFLEFPANPLLTSPDLSAIDALASRHGFPLLVDETIGTFVNVDVLPKSDVVATSLTKFFSGRGDVMAGSLILNANRPLYAELKQALSHEYEDLFFPEDARVLLENSRDFAERVARINRTTETLCDVLQGHPAVARIDYPKYRTADNYRACLKPGGGYGGLFSILLRDPEQNAPRVFDELKVSKGPNLGTDYTLCCPYTILAHYRELDFAESCGVSRYLLRVSIGLEEPDWLIERFTDALNRVTTASPT